jgi:hypothetical protein
VNTPLGSVPSTAAWSPDGAVSLDRLTWCVRARVPGGAMVEETNGEVTLPRRRDRRARALPAIPAGLHPARCLAPHRGSSAGNHHRGGHPRPLEALGGWNDAPLYPEMGRVPLLR